MKKDDQKSWRIINGLLRPEKSKTYDSIANFRHVGRIIDSGIEIL